MADRVIAILNQKGGTGKTTLALNLAAGLARRAPTVVADADPQRSISQWISMGISTSEDAQGLPPVTQIGADAADPCGTCRGAGRLTSRKTVEIEIPPGVDSGNRLRVQGQGNAGDPGARRGDLELVIRVREHRFFQRDGHNLICQWPITFSQAALGGPIEITTLTGDRVQHHIPKALQTHEVIRINGHGMPSLRNASKRGDLLIQVVVDTPQQLTPEMEALFKQLAVMEKVHAGSPPKKSFFSKLKDWIAPE